VWGGASFKALLSAEAGRWAGSSDRSLGEGGILSFAEYLLYTEVEFAGDIWNICILHVRPTRDVFLIFLLLIKSSRKNLTDLDKTAQGDSSDIANIK
jgi:hypothetical protein